MKVNVRDLSLLTQEYNTLTEVRKWNPQQKQRAAYLQSAIAAVKAGASLAEIDQDAHNERAAQTGLPTTQFAKESVSEKEFRGWQNFVSGVNKRDMVEGAPMLSQIGTYTGLGRFVPNDFFPGLFAAMSQHDVLFDEDSCTVIRSSNGRPLPVPVAGDIENVASVISEAGSQTSVDIDSTGHAVIGAYSYSTPRFVVSHEAFQDLDSSLNAVKLFKQFASDRLARGIGADMVTGSGSSKTLGLLSSLAAVDAPTITASGAAGNTGGAETGVNSLGSADFSAAYADIDPAYLASPKCAWLMHMKTLAYVAGIVTKYGQPLDLVKYVDGKPTILGVPVKVSPSMPQIASSHISVVLGDLSYWATRLVIDDQVGVAVYSEAPGLVENGNVGLRCFARADGALLYTDTGSPCPFVQIQNHS